MRLAVALSLAIAIGIIAFTAAAGDLRLRRRGRCSPRSSRRRWAAVLFWRRPVVALDGGGRSAGLKVVSLLAAVLALVQLGRLAVFIVDASRTGFSTVPSSRWEVLHSCVTAYYVAGKAAPDVPNVYDDALYSLPGDPSAPRKPRLLDGFRVDVYEYPPPFLLLPRAPLSRRSGLPALPHGLVRPQRSPSSSPSCSPWRGARAGRRHARSPLLVPRLGVARRS